MPDAQTYRLKKKFTSKEVMKGDDGKPLLDKDDKEQIQTITHEVPPHWSHWVVNASGQQVRIGIGDVTTLREDYVKSLGDQIEAVHAERHIARPIVPTIANTRVEE